MDKKKYLLLLILFFLWLISSTSFILYLKELKAPVRCNFNENYIKDPVYYAIDKTSILNDFFETISLSGWSFVETENNNDNRCIYFILSNDLKSYEIKNDVYIQRPGVRTVYQEKNIMGDNLGFSLIFSAIDIDLGCYDIYIYCWENEENYGIADTGLQFVKEPNDIQIINWQSNLLNKKFCKYEFVENQACIDYIIIDNKMIKIRGWAWIPELNSENQKVYIELKNNIGNIMQYTTKSFIRDDVANVYNNSLYTNSGYNALIPMEEIADGAYTMRILVENGGKVWASMPYEIVKSEETVEFVG